MQNETFAKGEKKECPKINLAGSFLQPNIAAKIHKQTPIKKNTLN